MSQVSKSAIVKKDCNNVRHAWTRMLT